MPNSNCCFDVNEMWKFVMLEGETLSLTECIVEGGRVAEVQIVHMNQEEEKAPFNG